MCVSRSPPGGLANDSSSEQEHVPVVLDISTDSDSTIGGIDSCVASPEIPGPGQSKRPSTSMSTGAKDYPMPARKKTVRIDTSAVPSLERPVTNVSIRSIQNIHLYLGHSSVPDTELYKHIIKINM